MKKKTKTADPSLYVNAVGWWRVTSTSPTAKPVWCKVRVEPVMQYSNLRLLVSPVEGNGSTVVGLHKVWFESQELNHCNEAPPEAEWNS